jgi:hypothetical protein
MDFGKAYISAAEYGAFTVAVRTQARLAGPGEARLDGA